MNEILSTTLEAQPYLDLEDFMNFSKETRLEGETFEKLQELWQKWLSLLIVKNIKQDKKSWLAVWLPEEVEKQIDETWDDSPGGGYLLHNLAQYLCMATIQELIPQTLDGACAPSPDITPECRQYLIDEKFFNANAGSPSRRYGVLTYYPFKGGCEICAVKEECPKGSVGELDLSMVLPGYERGSADD